MRVKFENIKKVYLLKKGDNATMNFVYAELIDGSIHHVFRPDIALDEEEDILNVEPLDTRDILTGVHGKLFHPGGVKVISRLNRMTRTGYAEFTKRYMAQLDD